MPTDVLERGSRKVDRKVLSISSKRQITIPQKFYQTLGFGNEAECIVHGNELIIRPVKTVSGGEFAEQILAELIDDGLSGKRYSLNLKNVKLKLGQLRKLCFIMRKKSQMEMRHLKRMKMFSDRRMSNAVSTI